MRRQGYASDDSLYAMLGFEQSVRIDHSDYEAAEEQLDLNQPETPTRLRNAFDVVLDSGTIEHVFDIAQALKHCLEMARPGGRIIHLTPSSNSVNHGLYSVSPTLYADFYSASGCTVEKLWLCRAPRKLERGTWQAYDCLQANRNWLPLGRLDGAIWFTFAVIHKGPEAQAVDPQQSFYVSTWNEEERQAEKAAAGENASWSNGFEGEPADSRTSRLLRRTRAFPPVHALARWSILRWRRFINAARERKQGRIPFPLVGTF
ncbi:MAG: class I SAM-dependent methyltransferase [Aureliella sp.]